MKIRILLPSAVITTLSCLLIYAFVSGVDVYAQRARIAGGAVKPTASVAKVETRSTAYGKAAGMNSRLRSSLQWTFGGKAQTGWDIYVPLICHTVGTDGDPASEDFATAIAKWQSAAGLPETGVIDSSTLETFTRHWQSRRLGRFGLSSGDLLLSAPIAEFFDPTRSPDLLQLEQETYAAYRRMIAAAAVDLKDELKLTANGELDPSEKFLRIVSAYRSPEYQALLRKREPNAGRVALAKNSPHSTGHALDIYVGGEPVKTLDSNRLIQIQTPVYKWLVKNAERFGFYPYFYEPWHWEYVPGR